MKTYIDYCLTEALEETHTLCGKNLAVLGTCPETVQEFTKLYPSGKIYYDCIECEFIKESEILEFNPVEAPCIECINTTQFSLLMLKYMYK